MCAEGRDADLVVAAEEIAVKDLSTQHNSIPANSSTLMTTQAVR